VHYAALAAGGGEGGPGGTTADGVWWVSQGCLSCLVFDDPQVSARRVGVTISRGNWAKVVQKVSASRSTRYEELLTLLPEAARLNVDETGHPTRGIDCGPGVSAPLYTRSRSTRRAARMYWSRYWAGIQWAVGL